MAFRCTPRIETDPPAFCPLVTISIPNSILDHDLLTAPQLVLDKGDILGGAVSIAGALIISFWPR
jgi:hypothetical protein